MTDFRELLKWDEQHLYQNEPMKNHTSFRTGGNADYFIVIEEVEQLRKILEIIRQEFIPFYIMGNGTNLLVRDGGFHGVILQIYHKFSDITVHDTIVKVQSGALLSSIANIALEHKLSGFEFASGIPGTFGGAVCMNAGAYGGEIKDILIDVEVMDNKGEIHTLSMEELKLGYRSSIIPKGNLIVLGGTIQLKQGEQEQIQQKMSELAHQRKEKQPLNFPSAGSTFKRPTGYYAGKLISDCNLKGKQIGGAQVSEKHAGFIINKENATANDILELIDYCRKTVFNKYGVLLEPEVKIIGEN